MSSEHDAMTPEEIIRFINNTVGDAHLRDRVYYTLRKMKITHITERAVEAVLIFLALQKLNTMSVSVGLFNVFLNAKDPWTLLHLLGDKKVVVLKRGSDPYEYMLSNVFMQYYQGLK